MKRSGFYFLFIVALFTLLISPACSTTEEEAVVYDLTGNWLFSCQWNPGPHFSLNFTFTGALTNGVAANITDGHSGVYTVNNTAVEIITNYTHSVCGTVTDIYTGTFSSPTTIISGTHIRTHTGMCALAGELTWTAIKL